MSRKQTGRLFSGILLAGLVFSPLIVEANDTKGKSDSGASQNLEAKVKEALHEHKHVTFEIKGQDVILRGHVNTQNEKNILEDQIRGVPGITYVRDEVKVEHSKMDAAEDYVEDAEITTKLKTKIFSTKGLDSLDIHVKTVQGIVTLSGTVKNTAEIDLAEKVSREVKGVKGVVNKLSTSAK